MRFKLRRWTAGCAFLAAMGLAGPVRAQQPEFAPPAVPEPQIVPADEFAGATAAPPAAGLSQAEVERIVADYLAKREAEQQRLVAEFASETKTEEENESPKSTVVGDDLKMSGRWKDGGQLESADKAFRAKWRGRTQFDTSGYWDSHDFFTGLGGNQGQAAVDFRRLRLGAEGTFYDQFDWALELDFMNSFNTNGSTNDFANNNNLKNAFDRQFYGVPAPTDVYLNARDIPLVGNVRVGNIKPPNSLEHATSSRFLDFMER